MLRFKRISSYVIACIALVSLAILPSKLTAQVAEGINYQAVVRDASNNVLGNTDISVQFSIVANSATGSIEYNEKLSKQRATNVTKYLISMGLGPKNVIANHYGELKPVVDCDKKPCDDADHALNRRTMLKLIKL